MSLAMHIGDASVSTQESFQHAWELENLLASELFAGDETPLSIGPPISEDALDD